MTTEQIIAEGLNKLTEYGQFGKGPKVTAPRYSKEQAYALLERAVKQCFNAGLDQSSIEGRVMSLCDKCVEERLDSGQKRLVRL